METTTLILEIAILGAVATIAITLTKLLKRTPPDELQKSFRDEAERLDSKLQEKIGDLRKDLALSGEERARTLNSTLATHRGELSEHSKTLASALADGRAESSKTFAEIRKSLENALKTLRDENSKKLDEMRNVVEEKLQSALEIRIKESFKLVNDRLESVHKSLGEMQTVAASVGDLKRVLTNVKTRGTWGEIQLGALLEDMLTSEQFAQNVKPNPRSQKNVEFAICLPGNDENPTRPLYLPIDSKFPIEDYKRILDAAEKADEDEVKKSVKSLGNAVESFAREIREKYICPPHTTDFAILYLPTEGLYAEVLRINGLAEKIQRETRVVIAGPTTLSALLNSLQLGFRTLSIRKNSAKIAQVLTHVKTDFQKFEGLLENVSKKLEAAQKALGETTNKHGVVLRKLASVETLEIATDTVSESEPRA